MTPQAPSRPRETLSATERHVVMALCENGETNMELANRLFRAESTIKFHLTNAMRLAGVKTRVGLALWWVRTGQYEGDS